MASVCNFFPLEEKSMKDIDSDKGEKKFSGEMNEFLTRMSLKLSNISLSVGSHDYLAETNNSCGVTSDHSSMSTAECISENNQSREQKVEFEFQLNMPKMSINIQSGEVVPETLHEPQDTTMYDQLVSIYCQKKDSFQSDQPPSLVPAKISNSNTSSLQPVLKGTLPLADDGTSTNQGPVSIPVDISVQMKHLSKEMQCSRVSAVFSDHSHKEDTRKDKVRVVLRQTQSESACNIREVLLPKGKGISVTLAPMSMVSTHPYESFSSSGLDSSLSVLLSEIHHYKRSPYDLTSLAVFKKDVLIDKELPQKQALCSVAQVSHLAVTSLRVDSSVMRSPILSSPVGALVMAVLSPKAQKDSDSAISSGLGESECFPSVQIANAVSHEAYSSEVIQSIDEHQMFKKEDLTRDIELPVPDQAHEGSTVQFSTHLIHSQEIHTSSLENFTPVDKGASKVRKRHTTVQESSSKQLQKSLSCFKGGTGIFWIKLCCCFLILLMCFRGGHANPVTHQFYNVTTSEALHSLALKSDDGFCPLKANWSDLWTFDTPWSNSCPITKDSLDKEYLDPLECDYCDQDKSFPPHFIFFAITIVVVLSGSLTTFLMILLGYYCYTKRNSYQNTVEPPEPGEHFRTNQLESTPTLPSTQVVQQPSPPTETNSSLELRDTVSCEADSMEDSGLSTLQSESEVSDDGISNKSDPISQDNVVPNQNEWTLSNNEAGGLDVNNTPIPFLNTLCSSEQCPDGPSSVLFDASSHPLQEGDTLQLKSSDRTSICETNPDKQSSLIVPGIVSSNAKRDTFPVAWYFTSATRSKVSYLMESQVEGGHKESHSCLKSETDEIVTHKSHYKHNRKKKNSDFFGGPKKKHHLPSATDSGYFTSPPLSNGQSTVNHQAATTPSTIISEATITQSGTDLVVNPSSPVTQPKQRDHEKLSKRPRAETEGQPVPALGGVDDDHDGMQAVNETQEGSEKTTTLVVMASPVGRIIQHQANADSGYLGNNDDSQTSLAYETQTNVSLLGSGGYKWTIALVEPQVIGLQEQFIPNNAHCDDGPPNPSIIESIMTETFDSPIKPFTSVVEIKQDNVQLIDNYPYSIDEEN